MVTKTKKMKKYARLILYLASLLVIVLFAFIVFQQISGKQDEIPFKKDMIMVNHVGFLPEAAKYCVIPDPEVKEFSIHQLEHTVWTEVFRGKLTRGGTELAKGCVGNFTELRAGGIYQIRCGELRSRCFVIHEHVYDVPMRVVFNYFPWQRCGDSKTGWTAPCHLEDGMIAETGEHVDLAGGYHQSCDLRKWAELMPIGLNGLAAWANIQNPEWGEKSIEEELRWGCDYFHKLVREDGGVPHSVFVPIGWGPREWYQADAPVSAHWTIIRYLSKAAEYFKQRDPDYNASCRELALRIWHYMNSEKRPAYKFQAKVLPPLGHDGLNTWYSGFYKGSALDEANRLCAATALFKCTGDSSILQAAAVSASALTNLQVEDLAENSEHVAACFWEGPDSEVLADSYFYFWHTSGPLGLCEVLNLFPGHPEAFRWRRAVERIAGQHMETSRRNPWGIVATRWYAHGVEPPIEVPFTIEGSQNLFTGGKLGARKSEGVNRDVYYEYFPFGYNMDIMAAGLFMRMASEITGNPSYKEIAQRQLDWIMGCNPFDASAIEGVGYNQPHRGFFGEFFPPTPQIPGAVSVGVHDKSFSQESYGFANEYDMPPTGYTLWLMAEQAKENH